MADDQTYNNTEAKNNMFKISNTACKKISRYLGTKWKKLHPHNVYRTFEYVLSRYIIRHIENKIITGASLPLF
jgi:hypothetical protein